MNIQTGIIKTPQKIVIYGPEGVGKSTLAAQFPNPLFIDTESSTKQLDVARIMVKTWDDIQTPFLKADQLQTFETLILDTVDWAVSALADKICADQKKKSIEDFGFGKGYTILAEEFAKFLNITTKAAETGKTIIFLAHSHIKRYDSPEASYDRYELKMHKLCSHLLKEAADAVLFANYRTTIVEDNGKSRAIGGKERVLYTCHTSAWDAKNRHALPERINMDIQDLAPLITKEKTETVKPFKSMNEWDILLSGKSAAAKKKVTESAIKRGWIQEGQTYKDIEQGILARAQENPEKFFAAFGI
jgi:GTPase SAR1 family protein